MEIKASYSHHRWSTWHVWKSFFFFSTSAEKGAPHTVTICSFFFLTETYTGIKDSSQNPERFVNKHKSHRLYHLKKICQGMWTEYKSTLLVHKSLLTFKKTSLIQSCSGSNLSESQSSESFLFFFLFSFKKKGEHSRNF